MQEVEEKSCHNTNDKSDRKIDTVIIKICSYNSIRSVIMTKLETSSRQNVTKLEYKGYRQ